MNEHFISSTVSFLFLSNFSEFKYLFITHIRSREVVEIYKYSETKNNLILKIQNRLKSLSNLTTTIAAATATTLCKAYIIAYGTIGFEKTRPEDGPKFHDGTERL